MITQNSRHDIQITVLVAVYNGEKYLAEAINSILNQTYTNFEFLIINDGSTDNSESIILNYKAKDSRIKYVSTENRGYYNALNLGLKEASNEWIALNDCDDISLQSRLERQIEIIKSNPKIKVLSSYGYYIGINSNRILGEIRVGPTSENEYYNLIKNNKLIFILHGAAIIHKKTIVNTGGYRFSPLEDLDLWNRIADTKELIIAIPEPLILYRKKPGSMTEKNVFELNRRMRWIKKCMIERRSGKKEPPYSDFCSLEKSMPLLTRLNMYRKDLGTLLYKRFGISIAYHYYFKGILYGIIALMIYPGYFFKKIISQQGGIFKRKLKSLT